MPITDNLKNLLLQQKGLTVELEKEVSMLQAYDIVSENNSLKDELTKSRARLDFVEANVLSLSEENKNLKNTLYEQLYNEKITILNMVNRKVDAYYLASVQGEINRLKEFELHSKRRIDDMMNTLNHYRVDSEDEIFTRINELRDILNQKVTAARQEIANRTGAYSQNKDSEFRKLHEEGVSEREIKSALKKNNIESLIGLNILNKLGILFLIIGVIAITQFTYLRLPDVFKSVFAFMGGAALLIVGEILNRKKPNVFSLGITSGGIAVLYVALALSYFGLNILTMYPALIICVIVTAFSFVLSQRYNAQTIATFSLIGGYLPILSITGNKTLVYSAMVYFVILNLLALLIALHKKWSVTALIGFVLNVFGTCYIMSLTLYGRQLVLKQDRVVYAITIVYIIFAFLIYTLIPMMNTYFKNVKLGSTGIVLLGLNTYISAILLYIAFFRANLSDYTGLLAVIFALIYLILGKFTDTKLMQEKKLRALFYLTGFTFVILIIPFQFEVMWLSLGWLIEGIVLVTYGILKEEKTFRRYGYIICSLCISAFLLLDVVAAVIGYGDLFAYRYLSITIGSVIIISAYGYKKRLFSQGVLALKYATYINLWIFMLYMVGYELSKVLNQNRIVTKINTNYLLQAFCIAAGFLLAFMIPRIKILSDVGMKIISMGIYGVSILWLFSLNNLSSPNVLTEIPARITLLGSVILIILNLISILAMMDLLKGLVLDRKLGTEWYPLLISVYFVVLLTQNLIMQYQVEFTNFLLSIIYILLAFSWIVFGFVKRYAFIRRFGLGLSFMAIAKLFVLDLSFLSEGYRIISYFAFGITLIAISFVYQYFNKRLEVL